MMSPWILLHWLLGSTLKSCYDGSCKFVAKAFLWSSYDETVEPSQPDDQHLTTDSSIYQVAVDKNAAQYVQLWVWPMPDICRYRHSNTMFCRNWLHVICQQSWWAISLAVGLDMMEIKWNYVWDCSWTIAFVLADTNKWIYRSCMSI